MSMLLFHVSKRVYAIDSLHIFRIIPFVDVKEMSSVPTYIAGFLNIGGQAIPVLDFCQLMERRAAHRVLSTRIMLVKDPAPDSDRMLGIVGENIRHFIYEKLEEFNLIDFNLTPFPFINRVLSKNSELIQYVDLKELFIFLSNDLYQPKEAHGV